MRLITPEKPDYKELLRWVLCDKPTFVVAG